MSYNEPTPPRGGPADHWCGTYSRFVEEWCGACQAAASERIRETFPDAPNRPGYDPVTIPDEAMSELLEPVLASYGTARPAPYVKMTRNGGHPFEENPDDPVHCACCGVDAETMRPDEGDFLWRGEKPAWELDVVPFAEEIERMRNDPGEFARMVMPGGSHLSEGVLAQLRLLAAGSRERVLLAPRVIERPASEGGRHVTYFVVDDVLPTFPEIDLAKALARHEAAFSPGKYHHGDLLDILRRVAPLPHLWHRDKLDMGTRVHRRYDRQRRDARRAQRRGCT